MNHPNDFKINGDMIVGIANYRNEQREFYFDSDDYNFVKNHIWRVNKQNYVYTTIDGKNVFLHRFVMGLTKDISNSFVDHMFHNTLDNRKSQLRICTPQQNQYNKKTTNSLGFKNIHQDTRNGNYVFSCRTNSNGEKIKASFKDLKHALIFKVQSEEKIHGDFRYKGEDEEIELMCKMSINDILRFDVAQYKNKLEKRVAQYSLDDVLVKEWNSTSEPDRELGFNKQHIGACCRGVRKTHKGYKWKYID